MPEEEKEEDKLNRLEELKTKLWTKDYETRIEHHGFFPDTKRNDIPESFEEGAVKEAIKDQNKFLMKTSMFKKFFIFSIVFFFLAILYAAYMFFVGGNTVSNNNIEISVLGKTFTNGGEDLPLVVEIVNKNNLALLLADLVVEYPTGASNGNTIEKEKIRISLGTINSGATHDENIKLVLFGEQGSLHNINITLEYRIEGSNSIFVKEKAFDVVIDSTPINLLVDAPTELSPNQDMEFIVKASLNSNKVTKDMLLRVDYPPGFEFSSSAPAPTSGNNIWSIGDLTPSAERIISIKGKMVDVFDGEEKVFHVWSGIESKEDKSKIGIIFNSLKQTIIIKRPFIEAKLFVNGVYQNQYASDTRTGINGKIHWVNNLDTKINDLEIRAKITGNVVNRKTIVSDDGFYNSLNGDVIIWDKNSQIEFAEVNPGREGTVSFSLSPLPVVSASYGISSEPSINIEVSITGKQSLEGNIIKKIDNSESKIIRIITDMNLTTKALYYSGPFENKGPIPPTVAKETTYTIIWSLSNTSNPVSKAQVKSSLPSYMRYVRTVSPATESVVYNEATREIIWNAGSIQKGASITNTGKEVAFQVAFTPSLSQIGATPIIINEALLTGHDDFANVDIKVNKYPLDIRLPSDPKMLSSGGRVIE